MADQTEETQREVQTLTDQSFRYMQQLHIWLGIGSAGGAVSVTSLAASLTDPQYAFQFFSVSLWCFLVGVVCSGVALFSLAMQTSNTATHIACAHNRDELKKQIRSTPQIIAAPQRLADEANQPRKKLIEKNCIAHKDAENAWMRRERWKRVWIIALLYASASFILGFAYPLIKLTFINISMTP